MALSHARQQKPFLSANIAGKLDPTIILVVYSLGLRLGCSHVRKGNMRIFLLAQAVVLPLAFGLVTSEAHAGRKTDKLRAQCSSFGYQEGTDAFADCVMKLTLKQQRDNPDRDTLVRRYRESSMARRGDNRYPGWTGGIMDNVLGKSLGKWVGPSCQMAPD